MIAVYQLNLLLWSHTLHVHQFLALLRVDIQQIDQVGSRHAIPAPILVGSPVAHLLIDHQIILVDGRVIIHLDDPVANQLVNQAILVDSPQGSHLILRVDIPVVNHQINPLVILLLILLGNQVIDPVANLRASLAILVVSQVTNLQ